MKCFSDRPHSQRQNSPTGKTQGRVQLTGNTILVINTFDSVRRRQTTERLVALSQQGYLTLQGQRPDGNV